MTAEEPSTYSCAKPGSAAASEQLPAGYYQGPLQLVRIDDDGICHLEAHAASLLSGIQGRLAVVGACGLYRTGKSFLLNRLLGLQDGFEVGPTSKPCTRGLWVWGQPVQIEPDYHCIYIDSEGLGSTQRTASCDLQIFSLCVLLSSFFIYNSIGTIDEQAIDELHLVANLAKHIHLQSSTALGQVQEGAEPFQDLFPSFLWTLRDFHLEPVDNFGWPLSDQGYLENALKPVFEQEEKNSVREAIREVFPERNCVTLPRPCGNEEDLRHVQKIPYESLRPQFREKVEGFVTTIYSSVKPKTINGNHVSGSMFVSLAAEYIKSINSSGVPTIHSTWMSVVQHQLRLSLHDATQVYEDALDKRIYPRLPLAEEELFQIHNRAKTDAVNLFLAARFDANDPQFLEYREELATRLKQMYEDARVKNSEASRKQCEASAEELYSQHIAGKLEGPDAYKRIDLLMQDWATVQHLYNEIAIGPAKADVLARMLASRMKESCERVCESLTQHGNAKLQEISQQLVREEANSQEQSRRLEEAEKKWHKKQRELDRRLADNQRILELSAQKRKTEKEEEDEEDDDLEYEPERSCAAECVVA